jgi:NAD(P)-dependent dehydrogenase (short-subunit alcohol dehydrogenase family)
MADNLLGKSAMRRSVKRPETVLITGASSGIGEALAVECAIRGVRNIFFCGRDEARVSAVEHKCQMEASKYNSKQPSIIRGKVLDVTDEDAVRKWLEECNSLASLEVVFSNAGIGTGIENEENVRKTFSTNVGGNLNVVLPTIDIFRKNAASGTSPVRQQIVLTASIAGYAPLSTCPSYAATKAAMKSWGLSLRGMLKGEGIWVNVLCPGFIRSRITDRNTCPMPFFMEADKAVKIILDRVDRNIGLIAFPWPMRFGVWLLSFLPWRISEFISGILPEKTSNGHCKGRENEKIAF